MADTCVLAMAEPDRAPDDEEALEASLWAVPTVRVPEVPIPREAYRSEPPARDYPPPLRRSWPASDSHSIHEAETKPPPGPASPVAATFPPSGILRSAPLLNFSDLVLEFEDDFEDDDPIDDALEDIDDGWD